MRSVQVVLHHLQRAGGPHEATAQGSAVRLPPVTFKGHAIKPITVSGCRRRSTSHQRLSSAAAWRTMHNNVRYVCVCVATACHAACVHIFRRCAHVPADVSANLCMQPTKRATPLGVNANLSVQRRATPLAYIFRDLVPSSLSRARSISLWVAVYREVLDNDSAQF